MYTIYSISIFLILLCFSIWFYHIHWFYPHRSFKCSNWWRHKL